MPKQIVVGGRGHIFSYEKIETGLEVYWSASERFGVEIWDGKIGVSIVGSSRLKDMSVERARVLSDMLARAADDVMWADWDAACENAKAGGGE